MGPWCVHVAAGFFPAESTSNLITDVLKISNQPLSELVLFIKRLVKIFSKLFADYLYGVIISIRSGGVLTH